MRRRLLFVTLLIVPSLAVAQRGGGGKSQAGSKTDMFDKDAMPKGPAIRARDLEDQSPIKLLIDKRKDLKLTDAQLSQLKDAEPKLKDKNAPLLKAVDSLVRDMRPAVGSPSDEDKARQRDARSGFMNVWNEVHANYDAAAKDALAQFDPEQQTKANELLAKQKEESGKMLREKLGGGS